MTKLPKDVHWIDREGNARVSFAWRAADEQAMDECGLDNWEQAGFFGPYRCDTWEQALDCARRKLSERGFDPAQAEKLVIKF